MAKKPEKINVLLPEYPFLKNTLFRYLQVKYKIDCLEAGRFFNRAKEAGKIVFHKKIGGDVDSFKALGKDTFFEHVVT